MAAPRILFYAVNGLGLGHVTRLLAIARQVRLLRSDAQCVFLTASEAGEVIYREGFPAFKVPSRTARAVAALEPARYARMVQTTTWSVVSSFDPHVLVVDTFPAGTLQELLPVLRWNISKVFVFREQRPEYAGDPYLQHTIALYQHIIVPHLAGEIDQPLPHGVSAVWTGPILLRERPDAVSRAAARRMLRLDESRRWVLIAFGGGGDVEARRAAALCAGLQQRLPDIGLAVAPGPLWTAADLPADCVILHHYPLAECLAAFDGAIAAAGYNTVHELLHHGVPSVLLPIVKGVDDQFARAARYARCGAAVLVEQPDEQSLVEALQLILAPETGALFATRAQAAVPGGGALAAARAILELDSPSRLAQPDLPQ